MGFRKKKDREVQYNEYGISIGMPSKNERRDSLFLCLSKSIILFCIVYGVIGFYFSCFEIEAHMLLVGLGILVFSFMTGFLYYNQWTKNIGYVLALILFGFMAYHFYAQANSGFAAILNQTYEVIDDEFILPSYNIFTERIKDRLLTVTVCSLFLGFFGCLMTNIMITGKIGPGLLLVTMSPIFAIGLYFNGNASLWSIVLLAMGIAAMMVFRRETKVRDKKRCGYKKRKKKAQYIYHTDGKTMLGVLRQLLCGCLLIILLLFVLIPSQAISYPSSWTKLKASTREDVRNFFIIGAASFFSQNLNQGTGGLSEGRLGGVSSVRPDYEVDLNVTLVPYDYDRIYLKGYMGTEYLYGENRWLSMDEYKGYTGTDGSEDFDEALVFTESLVDLTPYELERLYEEKKQGEGAGSEKTEGEKAGLEDGNSDEDKEDAGNGKTEGVKADTEEKLSGLIRTKMRIENVGANETYLYLPYYSKADEQPDAYVQADDEVRGDFPEGSVREYEVYTVNDNVFVLEDEAAGWDMAYREYVKNHYLNVPGELNKVLEKVSKDAGLTGTKEEIVNNLINYFDENYSYTLRPGLLPWRTDFVSYFLDRNKQGYCAHFASAATLLLRYAGIPARYCEGYVVDYDQVVEGTEEKNESVDEWFDGDLTEWGQTLVVTAEVTDAEAHGWVEIYLDGYGWVPVETTPATDVDEDYSSFLESFYGLFRNGDDEENQQMDAANEGTNGGFSIDHSVVLWVGIILLAGCILWFVHCFMNFQKKRRAKGEGSIKNRIKKQYHYYQEILGTSGQQQLSNETLTEYRIRMGDLFKNDEATDRWFKNLEMVFYGYREEYEGFGECEDILKERIRNKEKELTIRQWIGLVLGP